MYAYLTMLSGSRVGIKIPLDPAEETLLGRGSECQISLADPLCSRVHARLIFQDGQWLLRDANSRNGTFVNEKKVSEATLDEGHSIRVGGSAFEYHSSDEPPTADEVDPQLNQTIVQEVPIAVGEIREDPLLGLPTAEQVKELMLLYQLTIKLLGCSDTDKVVHAALDLLQKRTNASLVGFLSVDDEGQLRPKVVVPADATDQVALSPRLTDLVLRQGHAVWVANQGIGDRGRRKAHRNWSTLRTPSVCRSCRAEVARSDCRWGRCTFICRTAGFASRTSISLSRWRISWWWRSIGRCK